MREIFDNMFYDMRMYGRASLSVRVGPLLWGDLLANAGLGTSCGEYAPRTDVSGVAILRVGGITYRPDYNLDHYGFVAEGGVST